MLNGVDGLIEAVRSSQMTEEETKVTAITFASHAHVVADLVSLEQFVLPELTPGGCTNFDKAITMLLNHDATIGDEDTPSRVFFFMDGYPTDDAEAAIAKFHSREWGPCASFAVAGGAEKHFLARLTPRKVYDLCVNPSFNVAIQDVGRFSR